MIQFKDDILAVEEWRWLGKKLASDPAVAKEETARPCVDSCECNHMRL